MNRLPTLYETSPISNSTKIPFFHYLFQLLLVSTVLVLIIISFQIQNFEF